MGRIAAPFLAKSVALSGSRRFPDFRPPDFTATSPRRFTGKTLALLHSFERPFPAGLR